MFVEALLICHEGYVSNIDVTKLEGLNRACPKSSPPPLPPR